MTSRILFIMKHLPDNVYDSQATIGSFSQICIGCYTNCNYLFWHRRAQLLCDFTLVASRVVRSNSPNVIGGDGDDLLTGGEGAQRFICGGGEDTITDYNEAEGEAYVTFLRLRRVRWWWKFRCRRFCCCIH